MKNKHFNVQLSSVRVAFFGKASLHQTSQPSKEDSVKLPKEVCAKLLQSRPTLRNPMDCSLPGSSVHGNSPSGILEWVARPSSRGSSRPRMSLMSPALAGGFFTTRTTCMWLFLFSGSVMSDSLRPCGLQHTGLPCPSPSPGVCLNSCSLSQ